MLCKKNLFIQVFVYIKCKLLLNNFTNKNSCESCYEKIFNQNKNSLNFNCLICQVSHGKNDYNQKTRDEIINNNDWKFRDKILQMYW